MHRAEDRRIAARFMAWRHGLDVCREARDGDGRGYPDARAGFTLIEVLAALVITTAFVAVVLPYAGRLATHWWVGETTVEAADGWMQGIARMSDDLAEAVPLEVGQGDPKTLAFRGGADAIRFVRPALGQNEGGRDLDVVSYTIRSTAAGQALVRQSRRFDSATFDADPAGSATVALIEGPFRFRLVTLDRDGTRRRGWDAPDRMPTAVELSVVATGRQPVPAGPILMPVVARQPAVAAKPRGATQ